MLAQIISIILAFGVVSVGLMALSYYFQRKAALSRASGGDSALAWIMGNNAPFPRQWEYGTIGFDNEEGRYWRAWKGQYVVALPNSAPLRTERRTSIGATQLEFGDDAPIFAVRVFEDELAAAKSVLVAGQAVGLESHAMGFGDFVKSLMNFSNVGFSTVAFRVVVFLAFCTVVSYWGSRWLSHLVIPGL